MAKHTAVLEKAATGAELLAPKSTAHAGDFRVPGHRAYAELAAKLFAAGTPRQVLAFASVNAGEGVTRTIRGLAAEIVRSGRTVATFDGEVHCRPGLAGGFCEPDSEPCILGAPRPSRTEITVSPLGALRERYDVVLIDCGSLASSVDLLCVAPHSDGVVLVVEAGRTTRDQLERAVKVVRESGARLAGCVLNKRRYPIPAWLYRFV